MNYFFNITLSNIKSRIFDKKILLLILILFVSKYTFAQYTLEGEVIDKEANTIIGSVNVKIRNTATNEEQKARSNISGKYRFVNIAEGEYEISASHIGYNSYSDIILIKEIDKSFYNIFMETIEVEIEKVNVTSTKTEVTLQQTPSSISIVTSEDINKKNYQTFSNVLEEIQGVTVNRSSGINVNSLSIRGSSDVAGGGIGNRVLLLLDGRPSLTGDSKGALWSLIPVSIIERTEVVKGAFSSLYGSSAIGGVVNVITKKPTYTPFTGINLSYGFYEKLNDSLRYTNDLLTISSADIIQSNTLNKFSYLLNFSYNNNDGHSQQSDYKFYSGIGKFTYDVFNNRDLEVTLQYTNSQSGFPHYWRQSFGKTDPYKVAEVYLGDEIKKETQSYDLFYRAIPNSKSKYTTRFYYYYLKSNSFYNPNNPVSLQYADSGQGLNTYIDSYNIGNISQVDFQLGRSNYLISGFDFQMNIVRSNPQEILYGDQQMNNFGLFVQDQFDFIKEKNGNPILSSTVAARVDLNKVISGIESFQINPKFSLIYTPSVDKGIFSETAFRGLIGRAFRAPSIAELYFKKELFGGFNFIYNPDLQPEEMLSAEIGFRKQYKTRFTFDFALFFNSYKNLIQYVNIGNMVNGPFQVQNVADAQIKGFEVYIDYSSKLNIFSDPIDYYFNIGYTYLNARDLSGNRKDDYLPYKPVDNFNFTTNFFYKGFNLNFNGRYLSAVEEVIFFKYEEPEDYFLFNIKLNKDITNKISVFLAVNNLFNESYQELERIQAPNRNYNSGVSLEF